MKAPLERFRQPPDPRIAPLAESMPDATLVIAPPGPSGAVMLLAVCPDPETLTAVTRAWNRHPPEGHPPLALRPLLEEQFLQEAADARSETGQAARHGTRHDGSSPGIGPIPEPDPAELRYRTLSLCHQASALAAMNSLVAEGLIAAHQKRDAANTHRALHLAFTALLTADNDPWPEDPDPLHAWHHFRTTRPIPESPELEAVKDILSLTASTNGQDCRLAAPWTARCPKRRRKPAWSGWRTPLQHCCARPWPAPAYFATKQHSRANPGTRPPTDDLSHTLAPRADP